MRVDVRRERHPRRRVPGRRSTRRHRADVQGYPVRADDGRCQVHRDTVDRVSARARLSRQRVQGPDLARFTDKTAPRVPITRHPDVRRSLMLQKAYAEGLRALYMYAAAYHYESGDALVASMDATWRRVCTISCCRSSRASDPRILPVDQRKSTNPRRIRVFEGLSHRATHPRHQKDHYTDQNIYRHPVAAFSVFRNTANHPGVALTHAP